MYQGCGLQGPPPTQWYGLQCIVFQLKYQHSIHNCCKMNEISTILKHQAKGNDDLCLHGKLGIIEIPIEILTFCSIRGQAQIPLNSY